MAFSGDNDVVDSVLYDVSGTALAITANSTVLPIQPMIIVSGLSGSVVKPINLSDSGALIITGSVTTTQQASLTLSGTVPITGTIAIDRGSSTLLPLFVTGTVGIGGPQPVVSGPTPLNVIGSVSAYTQGAQLVSGTVVVSSANVYTSGPQAVTGSVSVYTQGAQLVSGSVSVAGPTKVYDTGIQAISGSVSVYTQGAQLISGTVIVSSANVYTSGPQAVTGSVSVYTDGPQLISGTVIANVTGTVNLDRGNNTTTPLFISGTVGIGGPQTITGSVSTVLTNPNGVMLGTNANPFFIRATENARSAYNDLRVSTYKTLFDQTSIYEIDDFDFSTSSSLGGTVSYLSASGMTEIKASMSSGSIAILRTNTFFRYQAGKGQLIRLSLANSDKGQTNQQRNWGYFNDSDGVFFRLEGTTLSIVRRSSSTGVVTEEVIPQNSWNIDKMDGSGPSGINLDVSKVNIYEISLQWLGVGSVRYFINDEIVHIISNANTLSVPYMRSAQLPISCVVKNLGTVSSATGSIKQVCSAVFSEGGEITPTQSFAAYNTTNISVGTSVEVPLLSIRPKLLYAGQINRTIVIPELCFISTEGARAAFRIVLNGTLTGASWSTANYRSGVEFDVSGSSLSGGLTLYRGFLPNSNDGFHFNMSVFFSNLSKNLKVNAFATSQDTLTITGINEAAGTTLMKASIAWGEIR